jgi:hypothetical protein
MVRGIDGRKATGALPKQAKPLWRYTFGDGISHERFFGRRMRLA